MLNQRLALAKGVAEELFPAEADLESAISSSKSTARRPGGTTRKFPGTYIPTYSVPAKATA